MIPLLVSWIVLIAANATQQFKNSDIKTLLLLPAHREDPASIMDLDGMVVLSAGKTDRLFQKESIGNIKDVIGVDGFDLVIQTLDPSCTDPETRTIEIYSERLQNFVNYHAGDVSIIAFNSVRSLTDQENIFIEVLLNTTRAIVSLVDLAQENEEQSHAELKTMSVTKRFRVQGSKVRIDG